MPGVLLTRWEGFEGNREGRGLSPASVQRSRGRRARCGVEGVCVVFQTLARRGSWGVGRPGPWGRGQSVLPTTPSVGLPGLSSSLPALLSFPPSVGGLPGAGTRGRLRLSLSSAVSS